MVRSSGDAGTPANDAHLINFSQIGRRETTAPERKALFADFAVSAFRLELLPAYDVDAEKEEFAAYLRGDAFGNTENQDWVAYVEKCREAGKSIGRVHIIPRQLTDYLQFEIDWGYKYSALAGEDIRFVFADELPADISPKVLNDFWLFDEEQVLIQNYDSSGRWLGADLMTDPSEIRKVCQLRSRILELSFPMEQLPARLGNK